MGQLKTVENVEQQNCLGSRSVKMISEKDLMGCKSFLKNPHFSSYAGHWQCCRGNEPSGFYGHVTYINVSPDIQCLTATKSPYEGASLKLADCQYDYDSAATSGQYFE